MDAGVRWSAVRVLQKEFKDLVETPVEGFKVTLVDDSDLFVWDVTIFGPPQTLYEGGYFKARLSFPSDYPYHPPTMRFIGPMFHPNIFEDGNVCISILHSPGDDLFSGEQPSEQWNPTQNVRTVLLSVISLLTEPNIHSAAHVDASVAYRKWVDSKGVENAYERRVRELVERTKLDAKQDGVTVPTTLEEYCSSSRQDQSAGKSRQETEATTSLDGDDDYCFYVEDEEEFDEAEEIYEEAKDLHGPECVDEGVAFHHMNADSSPKVGVTNASDKSSADLNSSLMSFKN